MALNLIVTDAGRAALVNAANTGTAPVTIAQVGISPTALVPAKTATTLPGEAKRIATLSGDVVADDTIHLIVRDEGSSVYTVRSFALYLADGTLFAIYGQADPILEKSAQALMNLVIDIQFADIAATQLTFGDANFLNPPATTQVQGVVELATDEEATTGVDTQRSVTPRAMKAAVTSWLDARFGAGAPSAFMKGLLATASAAALRLALGLKGAALKDEGTGNGLDADLLDGQHGSYYANVVARLGYTPWGPPNDGSGSGLDADLLDGIHAASFARVDLASGATFAGGVTAPGLRSTTDATVDNNLLVGGAIKTTSPNAILVGGLANTRTAIHRNDGTNYYVLISDPANGPSVVWNDLRPFQIELATGILRSSNGQILSGGTYVSGSLTVSGNTVWHAANDGAGSGLDADLLDGLNGSAFARVDSNARQEFNGNLLVGKGVAGAAEGGQIDFARAPSGTMTGDPSVDVYDDGFRMLGYFSSGVRILNFDFGASGGNVWHSGNDGSGGGLDADLLDGQHGSYYANIPARLGYTPWGPANDGAGSGLDADLLDGYHGSSYDRITAINLAGNGGYITYASGFKRCWGTAVAYANQSTTIAYPIAFNAFSNARFSGAALATDAKDNNPEVYACTTTGCSVYSALDNNLSGYWVAEGY